MSPKKHQVWVLMPFLGLLLMSPNDVHTKYGRSIASDEPTPVVVPEVKPEAPVVVAEQKPEVKPDAPVVVSRRQKPEVKPEVKPDAPVVVSRGQRPEAKPEVKPEVKPETPVVVSEQKPEVKPETPVVVAEQKPEVKPEVKPDQPQAQSQTPKLDALLPASEIASLPRRQEPVNLNADILKEDITNVLSSIHTAESFDPKTVTREQLDALKKAIRDGAIDLVQVERGFPDIIGGEDNLGDLPERVRLARISLEASLAQLEQDEVAFAARPAVKPDTTVVASTTPATDAQRSPSVVNEETKPETKPEKPASTASTTSDKPSEEKDPVLCALEEQNKQIQQTLQAFISSQTMIMQQMMMMSQMMMMQNMYKTPDTFNYQQMYQYQQPVAGGNWVYYPNGLQPIQPGQTAQQSQPTNIFNVQQPQAPQYNPYGFNPYQQQFPQFSQPGMMGMGGQWGLQSQFNHTPGDFGLNSLSFNFGGQPSPQIPMAPAPQQLGGPVTMI